MEGPVRGIMVTSRSCPPPVEEMGVQRECAAQHGEAERWRAALPVPDVQPATPGRWREGGREKGGLTPHSDLKEAGTGVSSSTSDPTAW